MYINSLTDNLKFFMYVVHSIVRKVPDQRDLLCNLLENDQSNATVVSILENYYRYNWFYSLFL